MSAKHITVSLAFLSCLSPPPTYVAKGHNLLPCFLTIGLPVAWYMISAKVFEAPIDLLEDKQGKSVVNASNVLFVTYLVNGMVIFSFLSICILMKLILTLK
ncbi:hypothetical protein [Pectobacterium colocasium]|uniref:hypothetical protein n=1 Tax=Pectobacterium colocasium TaxID=2878098 RepID=UPI003B28ABD7